MRRGICCECCELPKPVAPNHRYYVVAHVDAQGAPCIERYETIEIEREANLEQLLAEIETWPTADASAELP